MWMVDQCDQPSTLSTTLDLLCLAAGATVPKLKMNTGGFVLGNQLILTISTLSASENCKILKPNCTLNLLMAPKRALAKF